MRDRFNKVTKRGKVVFYTQYSRLREKVTPRGVTLYCMRLMIWDGLPLRVIHSAQLPLPKKHRERLNRDYERWRKSHVRKRSI